MSDFSNGYDFPWTKVANDNKKRGALLRKLQCPTQLQETVAAEEERCLFWPKLDRSVLEWTSNNQAAKKRGASLAAVVTFVAGIFRFAEAPLGGLHDEVTWKQPKNWGDCFCEITLTGKILGGHNKSFTGRQFVGGWRLGVQ